jgi:hypothetical protein
MPIKDDSILEYFSRRDGHGRGSFLHRAAFHLMRIILMSRDFASLEELMSFCADPDKLRPWLPNETDRIILSAGLQDNLRDMIADRPTRALVPERASRQPRRAGGSGQRVARSRL